MTTTVQITDTEVFAPRFDSISRDKDRLMELVVGEGQRAIRVLRNYLS